MDSKKVKTITLSVIVLFVIGITVYAAYHYFGTGSPQVLTNRYLPKATNNWEIKTSTKDYYSIKQWGYSNTGRAYSTLISDTRTNTDVVFYRLTENSLIWQLRGEKKHELVTKTMGNNPVIVSGFLLDDEALTILPEPVRFADDKLGTFQSSTFLPNETFSGGKLEFGTHDYIINFVENTVKINS